MASTTVPVNTTAIFFMRATPFHEGLSACGRRLVSWLSGLSVAPSRPAVAGQWQSLRLTSPITVAGPRRTPTGFPSPPTLNDGRS